MQSMKLAISPENIKRNTDVIINLFGNLEINTANGILRESALKSPKICRLLAYIVLNRKPSVPARKVVRQFGQRKRLNQTILGKICGPWFSICGSPSALFPAIHWLRQRQMAMGSIQNSMSQLNLKYSRNIGRWPCKQVLSLKKPKFLNGRRIYIKEFSLNPQLISIGLFPKRPIIISGLRR